MQEDIIIRRRNRLKKHFVNVSNVLLYGYQTLSDAAKITYQVIDGFDWEDKDSGDSKGFVFPAIETIADIRNAAKRTIFRHLQELEKAGLVTRVRRRHQASILYIEDVSDAEAHAYLNRYVDKVSPSEREGGSGQQMRSAKNGTSEKAGEMPKMAVAYKEEENEKKENEINVNEYFQFAKNKMRYGMEGMSDIMKQFDIQNRQSGKQKTQKLKPEEILKRDFLADEMARSLGDQKSLGAFRKIAELIPESVVRAYLATVKETWQEGKIKKSRGALFVDMIQHYADAHQIALGFQATGQGTGKPVA